MSNQLSDIKKKLKKLEYELKKANYLGNVETALKLAAEIQRFSPQIGQTGVY